MTQWILQDNGTVVARTTVNPLKEEDWCNPIEKKKRDLFDTIIRKKLGSSLSYPSNHTADFVPYEDDEVADPGKPKEYNQISAMTDAFVGANIYLPRGEDQGTGNDRQSARVIGHYQDENGNLIGQASEQP